MLHERRLVRGWGVRRYERVGALVGQPERRVHSTGSAGVRLGVLAKTAGRRNLKDDTAAHLPFTHQ